MYTKFWYINSKGVKYNATIVSKIANISRQAAHVRIKKAINGDITTKQLLAPPVLLKPKKGIKVVVVENLSTDQHLNIDKMRSAFNPRSEELLDKYYKPLL